MNTFTCWENHHPRCENEEKWRKIWEEERAEIQKAEAEAQAELGQQPMCRDVYFQFLYVNSGFNSCNMCHWPAAVALKDRISNDFKHHPLGGPDGRGVVEGPAEGPGEGS